MAETQITLLVLVNKILNRLREASATGVDDTDYTKLLVQLINDAKREVEDAFNWNSLYKTIPITTVASTSSYALTDDSSDFTDQRTRVVEVYDVTNDCYITQRPRDFIRRLKNDDDSVEQDPTWYAFDGLDEDQNLKIIFHHTPGGAYTINVTVYSPQEDLSMESDTVTVPWYPVYLRALALALRERGDDEGTRSDEVFAEYDKALSEAMAYEQRRYYDNTHDGDWHIVSNGF